MAVGCSSMSPQVEPRSVETRVRSAPSSFAAQVTATVDPLTATNGRAERPMFVLLVVVPTVRLTQVTPRSLEVATTTPPVLGARERDVHVRP